MSLTISEIMGSAHESNERRGAYGVDPEQAIFDKLIEECDELSEALYRSDYKPFPKDISQPDKEFTTMFERDIKDTVPAELVDIAITALAGLRKLGYGYKEVDDMFHATLRHNSLREPYDSI